MNELNKVLTKREKILWQGNPDKKTYIYSQNSPAFIFGFFAIFFSLIFSTLMLFAEAIIGFIISILILFLTLIIVYFSNKYHQKLHPKIHYAITDKRIFIQTGLIGRDFSIIDYDNVSDVKVNVGIFDSWIGKGKTGTIIIKARGGIGLMGLQNIKNPYKVFSFLKDLSHDVRTDITYPNELRPKTNKGYKTKLKRK